MGTGFAARGSMKLGEASAVRSRAAGSTRTRPVGSALAASHVWVACALLGGCSVGALDGAYGKQSAGDAGRELSPADWPTLLRAVRASGGVLDDSARRSLGGNAPITSFSMECQMRAGYHAPFPSGIRLTDWEVQYALTCRGSAGQPVRCALGAEATCAGNFNRDGRGLGGGNRCAAGTQERWMQAEEQPMNGGGTVAFRARPWAGSEQAWVFLDVSAEGQATLNHLVAPTQGTGDLLQQVFTLGATPSLELRSGSAQPTQGNVSGTCRLTASAAASTQTPPPTARPQQPPPTRPEDPATPTRPAAETPTTPPAPSTPPPSAGGGDVGGGNAGFRPSPQGTLCGSLQPSENAVRATVTHACIHLMNPNDLVGPFSPEGAGPELALHKVYTAPAGGGTATIKTTGNQVEVVLVHERDARLSVGPPGASAPLPIQTLTLDPQAVNSWMPGCTATRLTFLRLPAGQTDFRVVSAPGQAQKIAVDSYLGSCD